MLNDPDQLYLDKSMEPPPDPVRTPELDERISSWLAAKEQQKHAAEAKKAAEQLLLVDCLAAAVTRYPYTDSHGKLRYFVPDTTARAKSIAAVSKHDKPKRGRRGRSRDVQIGEEVEVRRVPRTAEHDAVVDPFGATRGLLEEAKARQAEEIRETPAKKPRKRSTAKAKAKKGKGKR